MSTLAVPTPSAANGRPLSSHGMPKVPRITSSDQRHRFDGLGFSRDSFQAEYTSPVTPGPLSPPMSARSFSTVIDSEPSTPAYSPRMNYDWDGSSLVLLRPLSSSSEPASPSEPAWEMLSPVPIPQRNNMKSINKTRVAEVKVDCQPLKIKLAPVPARRVKMSPKITTQQHFKSPAASQREFKSPVPFQQEFKSPQPSSQEEIKVVEAPKLELQPSQAEARLISSPKPVFSPTFEEKDPHVESKDVISMEEKPAEATAAPLNKLASKMKSMLRRRSATDSHKEKKKKRTDYYEVQDVHWTEM